jgi:hypothetical protein
MLMPSERHQGYRPLFKGAVIKKQTGVLQAGLSGFNG